ncbi:hypothetical protein JCM5353_004855 [Sporobolomyces roseus]
MSVAAMLHHHSKEDLDHHRRNLEAVESNPNATPQEKAAARHAHATAIKRHAAIENRHQHLKDKLSLHHSDPTLTREENHKHHHQAAQDLFKHHDLKIRAIKAEHDEAKRDLDANPRDSHAQERFKIAQAKFAKLGEHRNSRHSAASHLLLAHRRKEDEARRRLAENPDDRSAAAFLETAKEHHAKLVQAEEEARKGTGELLSVSRSNSDREGYLATTRFPKAFRTKTDGF